MTQNLIIAKNSSVEQKVSKIVNEVLDAWKKTTETWLGIGKSLSEYQLDRTEEGKEVWKGVQTKLTQNGLGKSTIDKLVVIGKNKILQNKKYLKQLPASYDKLYSLTTIEISDEVFKQKLENGEINTDITTKEIQILKEEHRIDFNGSTINQKIVKLDSKNKKTMIEIQMTQTYLANNLQDINEKLLQVKMLFRNSKSVSVETKGLFKKKLNQGDVDE
jgi:hypothetical protein